MVETQNSGAQPVGLILAGGRSERMGGVDKTLLQLQGRTLLDHVIQRLSRQVGALALSANGEAERFAAYELPVLPDEKPLGPLAGILAGMDWAASRPDQPSHVVSVAGDTPFFPHDFVLRLQIAAEGDLSRIVVASSAGRRHPTCSLWPLALREPLRQWLHKTESYKVLGFIHRHDFSLAEFEGEGLEDPFFNVNTPGDLQSAETASLTP